MRECFSQILDYIDILSFKPQLKINGQSRYITPFGKIINFVCIIIIFVLSIFITMDLISRQSFSVIYNLDNRELPSIKINESQIALLLIDALGNEITEHDRYFNFMVKFWKVEIPSDYSQNTTDYKQTYLPRNIITDLPLRNCSSLNYSKFSPFYETFSKVYFSGVCIDFSNITDPLFGKYEGVEGFSTLNIYIRKCLNSTINNKTNCFPEDVIDKKLSQLFFNLIGIENDVVSNNFTHPIFEFYKNEMLPLSSTVFKNYFKDINLVKFRSDNGFLFSRKTSYQSYRTDRISESVDLRGKNTLFPGTFSQITFRCSGKTEIYDRTYQKVTATFAYIGGIIQALIMIGKSFVYIYSKNSMLNYLIYHIFDNEEVKNVLITNDHKRTTVKTIFSNKKFADTNLALNNNKNNSNKYPPKRIHFTSYVKALKFEKSPAPQNNNNNNIKNLNNEINLRNNRMNLINSNNKEAMNNNNILNKELNEIDKYFYSVSANKDNVNFRNRKIEESSPYQDVYETQKNNNIRRKTVDNYAANKNDDIRNNIKINSSNECILVNKNALDPNCPNPINNIKGE